MFSIDAEREMLLGAWLLKSRHEVGLDENVKLMCQGYAKKAKFSYEKLKETEWSPRFEKLMRNRLILGSMRYGLLNDPKKPQWDRLSRIEKEVQAYKNDGNLEHLVEIANHALLEFEEGVHPNKHWAPSDDGVHTERRQD